jgi:hypothetical protein
MHACENSNTGMTIINADKLNGAGHAHIHRFTFNKTGCK